MSPNPTTPATPPSQPNPMAVRFILWGALLMSALIYGGLGYFLGQGRAPMDTVPLLTKVFAGVAVMVTGMIFTLPRLLGEQIPAQTRDILRWALAESIGLFGLVLAFQGAGPVVLFSFVGWSVVLLALHMPRSEG